MILISNSTIHSKLLQTLEISIIICNQHLSTYNVEMQFHNLVLMFAASILVIPSEACKCDVDGQAVTVYTQGCCQTLGGVFQYGNDCAASSISDILSEFQWCCMGVNANSDCDP